jgi:cyclophilin family peptidyl-prolyl cis-trans isomerase
MRAVAAAVLGLCVIAADIGAQTRGRGRGAPPPEPGDVDLSALRDEDVVNFEQNGAISDKGLPLILNVVARTASAGGTGEEPDRTRAYLLRGLGRLERRDLITPISRFLPDSALSATAHLGLALTLRANASADEPDEEIARAVNSLVTTAPAAILGQLPYSTVDQFETAQGRLAAMLDDARGPRATAARGLEALARRNRKLGRLSDDTLDLLKKGARWELPVMKVPDDEPIARESFAALMAAGVLDAALIEAALGEDSAGFRRLGAFALFGTGATLSDEERTRFVRTALEDRDYTVRYDALRAWIRRETPANGCGPIAEALGDQSLHLVLAAIDALGDRCVAGDEAEALTGRLLVELRTPPDIGSWHREARALVAVAKRTPERAAMAMGAFRTHNVWQVRMYAARAAEPLKDVFTLQKLAYDDNDNVREAALVPLQRLAGPDSEPAFIAALGRSDYQLVLTAALGLKGRATDKYVLAAVVGALERITAEKKETSRDTRLALLERLREAGRSQAPLFEKLLADFDPRIAAEASAALRGMGIEKAAAPRPLPPEVRPAEKPPNPPLLARFELDTGRFFEVHFDRAVAPLAYRRICQLIRDKYYDGLTFHRVVPNFVVQGGSPGANEYAGAARFMRDELSERAHARGTVGLSTRGHHTGDAQIFVNLADNRILDLEYTVIGAVTPVQMPVVDAIQEGTRITRVQLLPDRDARR